ncbi:hypothetical protein [Faecalicoccus acidiformans]|uniref:DUF1146 domain-containing protein n=1 Tax=Faecalicoccus acidiformans TaxID=915173 RepID=A0ABS2FP22_9FIRM|nr:hypothetical protein [Faecalicoccus acidiformans]MBM6831682.1 hypothetical protein [Faecalicoccus acidiformans]
MNNPLNYLQLLLVFVPSIMVLLIDLLERKGIIEFKKPLPFSLTLISFILFVLGCAISFVTIMIGMVDLF